MGGGTMRNAAKAAAFAGYRSSAAARRAPAAPASAVNMAIDSECAPLMATLSSENSSGNPVMVQWPAWADWEFAGGKEDEAAVLLDTPPRLVFGPAPTLEEAEEATADLKEAIEKEYFSSGNVEDSIKVSQVKNGNSAILPSMSIHVVQAFSLLQGSPEAQSVVASLACDKNVWDAIMKNDKVLEFYNEHRSGFIPSEMNDAPNVSIGKNLAPNVESPDEETPGSSISLTDIVESIKVRVSELVSDISSFLQDFMGSSSESHGTTNTRTSTSTSADYTNFALGSSFVALAVATILVVLVKRS